jgi:Flp pilus assembly protein TadD
MDRARQLLAVGRPQDAIGVLGEHLAEHPTDPAALSLLSWAHLRCGEPEDALRAADRALMADPEHHSGWQHRSNALRELGRHPEAVLAAEQCVRLAPNLWTGHYTLGLAVRNVPARKAELRDAALRAASLAPENADTHVLLGIAHADAGEVNLAEHAYKRALSLDPDHAHARSNLSVLALRGGRFGDAMRGFRAAAGRKPQETLFHRNMAAVAVSSLVKYGYLLAAITVLLAGLLVGAFTPIMSQVDGSDAVLTTPPSYSTGQDGVNLPQQTQPPPVDPDLSDGTQDDVTPISWPPRLGALAVILVAWVILLWSRLRMLSPYLRRHAREVFGSMLHTGRFIPLFIGFVISQLCLLVLLLVPAISESIAEPLMALGTVSLLAGSVLARMFGRRTGPTRS